MELDQIKKKFWIRKLKSQKPIEPIGVWYIPGNKINITGDNLTFIYEFLDNSSSKQFSPVQTKNLTINTNENQNDNQNDKYIFDYFGQIDITNLSYNEIREKSVALEILIPTSKTIQTQPIHTQSVELSISGQKASLSPPHNQTTYLIITFRILLNLIKTIPKNRFSSFLDIFDDKETTLSKNSMRFWLLFYVGYTNSFQLIKGENIGLEV